MAAFYSRHNFFRSAFDALVEGRERQARRYANDALLMLDDETLKSNGLLPGQLGPRARRHYPF